MNRYGGHADTHAYLRVDLQSVRDLYQRWTETFPTIKPHYAVKCNPDAIILKTLAELGCNFDCASGKEMQIVLGVGVTPDRILFANTCKLPKDIDFAHDAGIHRMTCDSTYELEKIAKHSPSAQVILRIRLRDSQNTVIPFGSKFGAARDQWGGLVAKAKELGTPLVGVSFHVGSGCSNPDAYASAIDEARLLMDLMEAEGFHPHIVDIGGGFVAPLRDDIARVIKERLGALFDHSKYVYIAEPGRYMVETCATHYAEIVGKRVDGDEYKYWIADSIYGCFADVAHGYMTPRFEVVAPCFKRNERLTTIYGSTCDGGDIIAQSVMIPELQIGEWIKCPNMGAYTRVLASGFNGMGFDDISILYTNQ